VPPAYTIDDIAFDAETHTSRLPDGTDVPHVTAVLAGVGVSRDIEELTGISRRVAENVALATQRGSAVHADCHAYDDDDLDWETVDPRVLPFLDAWVTCCRDLGLTPLAHARERRLYHWILHYVGRMDGVFLRMLFSMAVRILADLKTADPEDSACQFQTAAYEAAWMLMHPDQPIDQRWAIWLRPERRVPYTIVNYSARPDAWQDFQKFQAFLTTYNNQACRRPR
jgi:hypothetical protein